MQLSWLSNKNHLSVTFSHLNNDKKTFLRMSVPHLTASKIHLSLLSHFIIIIFFFNKNSDLVNIVSLSLSNFPLKFMMTGVGSCNNILVVPPKGLWRMNSGIEILSMILAPNNFIWPRAIRKGWRGIFGGRERGSREESKGQGLYLHRDFFGI